MSIRSQLTLLAVAAVCLPLAAVLGFGLVMIGMHDEGKLVAVALASLLLVLVGALAVGRQILRPLDRLRLASARLASGDLGARASEVGPR